MKDFIYTIYNYCLKEKEWMLSGVGVTIDSLVMAIIKKLRYIIIVRKSLNDFTSIL